MRDTCAYLELREHNPQTMLQDTNASQATTVLKARIKELNVHRERSQTKLNWKMSQNVRIVHLENTVRQKVG